MCSDFALKVIFFSPGNICRSPIAEAVFQQLVKERGVADHWVIDSAAIGNWHEGNPADSRARSTLKEHHIEYTGRARQVAVLLILLNNMCFLFFASYLLFVLFEVKTTKD